MRIKHLLAIAAALLCASPAAFAAEGLESVDQAWQKAMLANDLNSVVACYGADAILWLPDAPVAKGTEAIRKCYSDLLAANTVTAATLTNTHYEMCGSMSIGWGEFSMTMTPKAGGNPVSMTGRFTAAAKKQGDKWVYAVDHASAHPPKG